MSAGMVTEAPEVLIEPSKPVVPAIVVEHVARRFGARDVLRDVSFQVQPGRALGIAGANGAGKTVLLRLLVALDRPTRGSIHVHGDDSVRQAASVRKRVGYVPEKPLLYEGITAEQYLHFVGRTRGLGTLVRQAAVDTLLQVVTLEGRRHVDVGLLSPGERQRLMLAAALVHEPDVLVLDDPLRGLDGLARLEQIEVLRELRRIGATTVVGATRPDDLFEVCDEVAVLRDGTIAWEGDLDAAAQLGAPTQGTALRVRAEILEGLEEGLALLGQRKDVSELEVDEDGQTLWFLFGGDREGLGALLPQLLRAGCTLSHFGAERRTPAGAIASLLR